MLPGREDNPNDLPLMGSRGLARPLLCLFVKIELFVEMAHKRPTCKERKKERGGRRQEEIHACPPPKSSSSSFYLPFLGVDMHHQKRDALYKMGGKVETKFRAFFSSPKI